MVEYCDVCGWEPNLHQHWLKFVKNSTGKRLLYNLCGTRQFKLSSNGRQYIF